MLSGLCVLSRDSGDTGIEGHWAGHVSVTDRDCGNWVHWRSVPVVRKNTGAAGTSAPARGTAICFALTVLSFGLLLATMFFGESS